MSLHLDRMLDNCILDAECAAGNCDRCEKSGFICDWDDDTETCTSSYHYNNREPETSAHVYRGEFDE